MNDAGAAAFAVAPYTPKELRFHITGAALNGLVWIAGLVWLFADWNTHALQWPWIALAILTGVYAADLVSGLLHWAFDTWFDEDIVFLRRMVLQVREHHVYPNRIFRIHFLHDAGTLSWIALILTAPTVLLAMLTNAGAIVIASSVFSVLLVTMLAFHKIGHRARQPRWILALQKLGLLISAAHHSQHHGGNHDFNYCLINGWADDTLGRAGFFRALERTIVRLTGAQPRRNDHEWLRRFEPGMERRRPALPPKRPHTMCMEIRVASSSMRSEEQNDDDPRDSRTVFPPRLGLAQLLSHQRRRPRAGSRQVLLRRLQATGEHHLHSGS